MQVERNAVRDRRNEIGMRQRLALIVRDGNQGHLREAMIEGPEICQIESAVNRRQGANGRRPKKWEV